MDRTHVVEGYLCDPKHIEVDVPLSDVHGWPGHLRPIDQPAPGSPQRVLEVMRSLPDLDPGDVDGLERMIEMGKLPTRPDGLFDSEPA